MKSLAVQLVVLKMRSGLFRTPYCNMQYLNNGNASATLRIPVEREVDGRQRARVAWCQYQQACLQS